MPGGLFLAVDGLDGTGKTTQGRLLADWLRSRGRVVTTCVDPGGTSLGAQVRALLLAGRPDRMAMRAEALLFLASRAQLVEEVIRPALDRREVVVSDRFTLANVAYQGHAGGLDVAELWRVGRFAAGGLEPDLTLLFDLPVEAATLRRGRPPDRLEARDRSYHEAVRRGFLAEAERNPGKIAVIDASGSADEVQATARAVVAERLPGG